MKRVESYAPLIATAFRNPMSIVNHISGGIRYKTNEKHSTVAKKYQLLNNIDFLRSFHVELGLEIEELGQELDKLYRIIDEAYSSVIESGAIASPSYFRKSSAIALYLMILREKPKIIVETGISDGMSSYIILKALGRLGSGKLYSIDLPSAGKPQVINRKPGWIVPEIYKSFWEVYLGKSKRVLPRIASKIDHVDIFLHDSEHTYKNMLYEFRWAVNLANDGTLILSDDALSNDALFEVADKVSAEIYINGDAFGGFRYST